jgi:hypothetical protein
MDVHSQDSGNLLSVVPQLPIHTLELLAGTVTFTDGGSAVALTDVGSGGSAAVLTGGGSAP